jgi:hypothetical protein
VYCLGLEDCEPLPNEMSFLKKSMALSASLAVFGPRIAVRLFTQTLR